MIVTLCGSTRFKSEYELVNLYLTLAGYVVISVAAFGHADGHSFNLKEKGLLDDVHLQKIDLADAVVVIDPSGYVGHSTAREIAYAERRNIPVHRLSDLVSYGPDASAWCGLLAGRKVIRDRIYKELLAIEGERT